ncbi:MAG: hypothetical protein LC687_05420 [Actinobacteria bacterium]|nr:hypothetical protein [Actinomycetota bacterium]MCA1807270.1 hypothetical protein [Actinomycetota bacterium]
MNYEDVTTEDLKMEIMFAKIDMDMARKPGSRDVEKEVRIRQRLGAMERELKSRDR